MAQASFSDTRRGLLWVPRLSCARWGSCFYREVLRHLRRNDLGAAVTRGTGLQLERALFLASTAKTTRVRRNRLNAANRTIALNIATSSHGLRPAFDLRSLSDSRLTGILL